MTRDVAALPASTVTTGVVAVLRADDAARYLPVCQVLVEAGVTTLELTLTTPGTIGILPWLRTRLPQAQIGVGTVLSTTDVEAAAAGGASFLVTPVTDVTLVHAAIAAGIPIVPGALTPTEIHAAWAAGAAAVKIFPAATVGPDYLRQLAGPFPAVSTMPSGGVELHDIAAWIRAGAVAVSLGGPLIGDALRGGDLDQLRGRARSALEQVRSARSGR